MPFPNIPFHVFDLFHREFAGDTPSTFAVCVQCGGACENKIGPLLPGEAEYMADCLGQACDTFRDWNLDGLLVENERMDVLKFSPACPFLEASNQSCRLRGAGPSRQIGLGNHSIKPLLCETYPLIFSVDKEHVRFFVDPLCPLVQNASLVQTFNRAAELLSGLPVPVEWWRRMANFDRSYFDFQKIRDDRTDPLNQYAVFRLEELWKYNLVPIASASISIPSAAALP